MPISKVKWIASDGTQWDTEQEATIYESILTINKSIDDFLSSMNLRVNKQTEYQNVIKQWEIYKRMNAKEQKSSD